MPKLCAALMLVLTAAVHAQTVVPEPGTAAPTFTLTNYNGVPFSLEKFRGSWVVLYFYPSDFAGLCTLEARKFQRDLAKYAKHGALIVGVNTGSEDSHRQFRHVESLGFSLLVDTNGDVSRAYGSLTEGKLSARNTFLINPDGKIAKVFIDVDPRKHSAEVLEALGTLSPLASEKISESVLTNDGVVTLVAADLGDEIVIAKIKAAAEVKFDTSTTGLVALKQKKVSSLIIAAMIERESRPTSSESGRTRSSRSAEPTAASQVPPNPCAELELLGLFKEDMRPMAPLIVYLAKIRNSSSVTRIVRLEWLDMYGQAMQSTVQVGAGAIVTLQLAAQEPFQRQPIELRLSSCK